MGSVQRRAFLVIKSAYLCHLIAGAKSRAVGNAMLVGENLERIMTRHGN